jgi:hypothetical protein
MSEEASIDLDCGIASRRITAWLDDELGLPREDGAWVCFHGQASCRICVEPLDSRPLGTILLERTRLVARGDAAAVEAFRKAFTLRFMSAGG